MDTVVTGATWFKTLNLIHRLHLCVLYDPQNKKRFSLHNINLFVFVMEKGGVFCDVVSALLMVIYIKG